MSRWVGGSACRVLLWPFWLKSDSARNFEESLLLFDGLSRCSQILRWEVEGSDVLKENLVQRQRRATIWCQHLWRYRPVFVKPVTPALEAKTVVANWAAVLTFTHQRWRAVSRHSNVPSVLTTSQSSGAAYQRPCTAHMTLVDSSRCVRCFVCSAAAASAGSWICVASVSAAAFLLLCAATAGAFGTVVVVHFPFELADGGFTRMSVFVTLIVSAGVFTLVDFYRWAAASV